MTQRTLFPNILDGNREPDYSAYAARIGKPLDNEVNRMECNSVAGPVTEQMARMLARNSDPITSHEAAQNFADKTTPGQLEFLQALSAIGRASTSREVAERAKANGSKFEIESIRKRSGELLGMADAPIEIVGRRHCEFTGQNANVFWFVNSKGRAA